MRLRAIIEGLVGVAKKMPIVLPLHPRTGKFLKKYGLWDMANDYLLLTEPLGYLDMVMLEKHAKLVTTDSGDVQKEAFFTAFRV